MSDARPADPIAGQILCEGKVIWYSRELGYGFIAIERRPDLLAHNSEVRRCLPERGYLLKGDTVRCKVTEHRGRPCAAEIELVEAAPE